MKVYPGAPPAVSLVPLDSEAACVQRLIAARESGATKAQAIGLALAGSDDVEGFEELWTAVEAERCACAAVSPADHHTVSEFKAALPTKHLDATKWYNGLKAHRGVSTYAELRAKYPAVAEV